MVLEEGVTEIPDSEEEPMTSSPVEVSDKPLQASQDAAQPCQAPATAISELDQGLVGSQENLLRDAGDGEDNVLADSQVINDYQQHDVDMKDTFVSNSSKLKPAEPIAVPMDSHIREGDGILEEQEPMTEEEHVDTPDITASADMEPGTASSPGVGTEQDQKEENWQEQGDVLVEPADCSSPQATEGGARSCMNASATTPNPGAGSSDYKSAPIVDSPAGHAEHELPEENSHAVTSLTTGTLMPDSAMTTENGAPETSAEDAGLTDVREPSSQTGQIEKRHNETDVDLSYTTGKQEEAHQRSLTGAAVQSPDIAADSNVPIPEDSQITIAPLHPQESEDTKERPDIKPTNPVKSSQEATLAELRAQRTALIAALAALPNIHELLAEDDSPSGSSPRSYSEPTDADIMLVANKLVKKHIKLLHEYNEIKDAGQGLMGLIADQRGVRIVEVQDEFGIGEKD